MLKAHEVHDRTLIICVEGPMTPFVVAGSLHAIAPAVVQLHANKKPWGTILIIEKDATWFPEAIELLVGTNPDAAFSNRVALAFVIAKDVHRSHEMVNKLVELYGHKINAKLAVFDDMLTASKWVDQQLIESDK
jgi:hypothetical protein